MHVGSQWFSFPKHVVDWFVTNPLPIEYIEYAQHIIVADEHYFATMLLNSPYCQDVVKKNHVLLLFDKWENELKTGKGGNKDRRKCLHPYPDHCGRSPTTLTMDDASIIRVTLIIFIILSFYYFIIIFDFRDLECYLLVNLIPSMRDLWN